MDLILISTNIPSWLAELNVDPSDFYKDSEKIIMVALAALIMLGMGASLTPRDFWSALRRPWGLIIGWVTQFSIMPLVTFILIILFLLGAENSEPLIIGALLMGSVPGGTTSNIFTYFSRGNLALSVSMTTHSSLWALLMTPLVVVFLAAQLNTYGLELKLPIVDIIGTLGVMLIPVGIGMAVRRYNANVGAVLELVGGILGVAFIIFMLATWVPRNFAIILAAPAAVKIIPAIMGPIGILMAYNFSKLIRLHPMNARTIGIETGVQNGPLAITIVVVSFRHEPELQVLYLMIPALYSVFIVILTTFITIYFRRANLAEEQKIPSLL